MSVSLSDYTLGAVGTGYWIDEILKEQPDLRPKIEGRTLRWMPPAGKWRAVAVHGRDLVYSGPIYKSMAIEGNMIRLQFDHIGGGLIATDGKPLREFTLANKQGLPASPFRTDTWKGIALNPIL